MTPFRILAVEDDPKWRKRIARAFVKANRLTLDRAFFSGDDWEQRFKRATQGGPFSVDIVETYRLGRQRIRNLSYDLAVIDVALPEVLADGSEKNDEGMQLLQDFKVSPNNRGCARIILTGFPLAARAFEAAQRHEVRAYLEKGDFEAQAFIKTVRAAIRDARLDWAGIQARERYVFTISFSKDRLLGCTLLGPGHRGRYVAEDPQPFKTTGITDLTNNINSLVRNNDPAQWRTQARSIGEMLHDLLAKDARIISDLGTASGLSSASVPLHVIAEGPAVGLGIPFELLLHRGDYLCFQHVITRRFAHQSGALSRRPQPFHRFVQEMVDEQEGKELGILILGLGDRTIPGAEREARLLKDEIEETLQALRIACHIALVVDDDVTVENITRVLEEREYHLLHYAGHGTYHHAAPEQSGVLVWEGARLRSLAATELVALFRNTELRLVFLNCCLSARTGNQRGGGDFYSIFEALVQVDIPIVLGYRWEVRDRAALNVAQRFYAALWQTFSPGKALQQARDKATIGNAGRDEETWASPILLMQSTHGGR